MKKPEEDKPILITVRNDVKDNGTRSDYTNPLVGEKELERRRSSKNDEVNIKDGDTKKYLLMSHEETSDVDSDYTIEMRSHPGSDDNRAVDDSDDDSVYSMEFKNIGGSDEGDGDDGDVKQSRRAAEDEVNGGDCEQNALAKKDSQKLDVDAIGVNNTDDDVASSEFSGSGLEEAAEQERTVTVRKGKDYVVDLKKTACSEILGKDEGDISKSIKEMPSNVHKNKRNFDQKKSLEVSEMKATSKFVKENQKRDDSTKAVKNNVNIKSNVDDKEKSSKEDWPVTELDTASHRNKSRGDDRLKNKASKGKKLLEEIKLLEQKLGKEKLKKSAGNQAAVENLNKKEVQNSYSSKSERSKSEKEVDGVTASKNTGEKTVDSGKRVAKAEKLVESSKDKKNSENIDRNIADQASNKRRSSDKKNANMYSKEQPRNSKDAASSLPKVDKRSADVVKNQGDKLKVEKKQAKSVVSSDKKKSKSNDVKNATSQGKRKLDKIDKVESSKKSQKFKKRTRIERSSESSDSAGSDTDSSSSSSSSDGSASESESDFNTESNESESNKSSDSGSDPSSDSSQSSISESESSSSEEDNFKRRRRRSAETKPVKNDVKQKRPSPRKEKEAGYVSPLRTKRSEWGTRRNAENYRHRREDEKDRKQPERRYYNRSYDRSRRYSKDRIRNRTRSRSRDRSQRRSKPAPRDRPYARGQRGSRDERSPKNHKDSQDRRKENRFADDFNRDGSRFRNERGSHDRKESSRSRPDDKDKVQRSLREVPGETSQDKANKHSEKRDVKGRDESNTSTMKSPQKKTIATDPNKSKSSIKVETSPTQAGLASRDNRTSDSLKEKSSDIPENGAAKENESKKPKPLMELDAKIEYPAADAGKIVSKSTSEPQHTISKKEPVSINESEQQKGEIKSEPRPLMEITLSNVAPGTSNVERRKSRRVSVTERPSSGARKESRKSRDHVERRHVLRIEKSDVTSTDAELTYEKQSELKVETLKEEPEEKQTVFNRIYLKRPSSEKAVYFENRKVEPLMKPIDFDIDIRKKPRIIEGISNESFNDKNIRRVIDSSSDVTEIQLTTTGMFIYFYEIFLSY